MNAFHFVKPKRRIVILDIPCVRRIKNKVIMLLPAQVLFFDTDIKIPLPAVFFDLLKSVLIFMRFYKKLRICLFKFTRTEQKIARTDFVPKGLPYLGNPKWYFHSGCIDDILEVKIY